LNTNQIATAAASHLRAVNRGCLRRLICGK
jgi:hypothetical protein